MNDKTLFTNDRIVPAATSLLVFSTVIFSPWPVAIAIAYYATWGGIVLFSGLMAITAIVVFEGSSRTVIYAASLARARMKKQYGFWGSVLDHVPSGLIAGTWMWASYTGTAFTVMALWLLSVAITDLAEKIFYNQFDKEEREELIELVDKAS